MKVKASNPCLLSATCSLSAESYFTWLSHIPSKSVPEWFGKSLLDKYVFIYTAVILFDAHMTVKSIATPVIFDNSCGMQVMGNG